MQSVISLPVSQIVKAGLYNVLSMYISYLQEGLKWNQIGFNLSLITNIAVHLKQIQQSEY